MRRIARSTAGLNRAVSVQHQIVDSLERVFHRVSNDIVGLAAEKRLKWIRPLKMAEAASIVLPVNV